MHEAALAREILTVALAHTAAERGARILTVRAWIAETEVLSPESLRAHFAAHAADTRAAGARLELAIRLVRARCRACDETYLPDHGISLCPRCGASDGVLLGATGLGVDSLDVELGVEGP
jgi:hydrogenase nickel incorporation protein HypA/HybF